MTIFRLFCTALLLLTANSALSQDVSYDFDHTADFSKFKTYRWVTLKSEAQIETLTDEQVKAALGAALTRKGLTKVEGDSAADLLIGYQTTEHDEEQVAGYPGFSPGPGWHSTGSSGKVWEIRKGELAVVMYDAAKHELVWRGVASKAYPKVVQPEQRQKNLDKAVEKLMKNYPPATQK